jgi:hypothetical protein
MQGRKDFLTLQKKALGTFHFCKQDFEDAIDGNKIKLCNGFTQQS